jgi:pilus assembly protein CpaB
MRPKPRRHRAGPASLALALRRRPRLRSALTVVVALVLAGSVLSVTRAAEQERSTWGTTVPVLVATADIGAGDRIDGSNVEVVAWPSALAPVQALPAMPADARAAAPIWTGEVVDQRRLAPGDLSPLAARLPPGTRAVAVPVEPGTAPPLVVGDRVDVLVALPAEAAGGGPPGFALATGAPVVGVEDSSVVVALSPDVAPRVAVALGQGAISLVLVGR